MFAKRLSISCKWKIAQKIHPEITEKEKHPGFKRRHEFNHLNTPMWFLGFDKMYLSYA